MKRHQPGNRLTRTTKTTTRTSGPCRRFRSSRVTGRLVPRQSSGRTIYLVLAVVVAVLVCRLPSSAPRGSPLLTVYVRVISTAAVATCVPDHPRFALRCPLYFTSHRRHDRLASPAPRRSRRRAVKHHVFDALSGPCARRRKILKLNLISRARTDCEGIERKTVHFMGVRDVEAQRASKNAGDQSKSWTPEVESD